MIHSFELLSISYRILKGHNRGIQLWFYTAYIYYGAYKLPIFKYWFFYFSPHQLLYEDKLTYISEFPYILTTLYEFYMNVDMQVI